MTRGAAHTPAPWRQGKTLKTPITKRWTADAWASNEQHERRMVYAYFSDADAGRSRVVVAECRDEKDAPVIAEAPAMAALLRQWLELANFTLPADIGQQVRLDTRAILGRLDGTGTP